MAVLLKQLLIFVLILLCYQCIFCAANANVSVQFPEPYCPQFNCNYDNTTIIPANVSFKAQHYDVGELVYYLPVRVANYVSSCKQPESNHFLSNKSANGKDALFSHGICRLSGIDNMYRTVFDAVVAKSEEAAIDLLNKTKGKIYSTYPMTENDFNVSDCVDSNGYRVIQQEAGRPNTCFALIAIEGAIPRRNLNGRIMLHSGWLSLNNIVFESFERLGKFLLNGNYDNFDITNDLVCIERYKNIPIQDYCAALTYPNHFYQICCCYNPISYSLCHVHVNPLIQQKQKFRCLHGNYDSQTPLTIGIWRGSNTNTFKQLADYCTITYSLTTTDPKLRYHFAQFNGIGEWEPEFESGPSIEIFKDRLYCEATYPTACPPEAKEKLAESYEITCRCRSNYCNQDRLTAVVEAFFREPKLCPGSDTLMEMLLRGTYSCFYYADLWTKKFYAVGFSGMKSIKTREPVTLGSNFTLIEFIMPACLGTVPYRGLIFYECKESPCLEIEDYEVPSCSAASVGNATSIANLVAFVNMDGTTKSNSTFRCFARAVFRIDGDSHQVIDLDAGAVDNMSKMEMIQCLTDTVTADCAHFQSADPTGNKITWFCCYHLTDPRQKLRDVVQSSVLPRLPADIRLFLMNRTVCFTTTDSHEAKCFTESDEMSQTQLQIFQFCQNHQNRRQCSTRSTDVEATIGFCCCGDSRQSCQLDAAKWGQRMDRFLQPQG